MAPTRTMRQSGRNWQIVGMSIPTLRWAGSAVQQTSAHGVSRRERLA
jgi:hypothetical protein